MKNKP